MHVQRSGAGSALFGLAGDYAQEQRLRQMTISGEEFLRRFLLHVLPDRFVRIRYFGLLANRHRGQTLALCRKVLPGPPAPPKLIKSDWQSLLQSLTGLDPRRCEVCGHNDLKLIGELPPVQMPRGPPQ
ncbi:MAG: transposase [bacterium]